MPTRQEIAEAVAILTGGRLAQVGAGVIQKTRAETRAFRALSRGAQARAAGAAAVGAGRFGLRQAVTKNPWGIAALLVYEGYINRDELVDLAMSLGGTMEEAAQFQPPIVSPRAETLYDSLFESLGIEDRPTKLGGIFTKTTKARKVSKSNKAVKQAMSWLKGGTKASSGAKPGILPKGAFKIAVKAASAANPNTPSRIGKGKTMTNKLARRLKKWW